MRRLLIGLLIFVTMSIAVPLAMPARASAAVAAGCSKSFLGLPAWYKYLDIGPVDGDPCAIIGPTQDDISISNGGKIDWTRAAGFVGIAVIEILLRIAALAAVGFVIYGGFRYITSQGEPEATKSARQTILNAIIGLVIAMIATVAVSFVASRLSNSTPPSGAGVGILSNTRQLA